ncbi:MAG: hypothetical protein HYX90_07500 [Chloroflexi bacterium]|nr:hypothetical protein [Chloroflexota bacterium]
MAKFSCCGSTFDGEQSYLEHRRLVHGEQSEVRHTCCGIQFFTDEGYAEHQLTVHGAGRAATSVAATPVGMMSTAPSGEGVHYLSRCKVCRTPIRGIRSLPYRLRGIVPFTKNPQLCNR